MTAPRCALLVALVTAAACAPRATPGHAAPVPPPLSIAPPSACDVPGDAGAAPDTLSVAVSGAVDPAPALAVAKRVPGIAWPIGTGAYWVSGATADLTAAPGGGARRPVLRWRPAGGDQRDLLDAGVDLLVTDDPGAVAYAATRADFSSVPLPWDRTYVLLAPVPVRAPAPILEDLARHVVRVEARPASPPFW